MNKKIEETVVGTYKKIEDGVVGAYKEVEKKFVDKFLSEESETTEEAIARIQNSQKELSEANRKIVEDNLNKSLDR